MLGTVLNGQSTFVHRSTSTNDGTPSDAASLPKMKDIDFRHLRLTNDIPTPHDRNLINAIISSIDTQISEVDVSIAVLEKELKNLKTRRATHVEQRSSFAILLSPLRSMPPEILGEIFLYAVAEHLPARFRVSHVCRHWRNTALATSELWSTIDADLELPKTEQRLQDYVQACAQRAKSRPLTLKCHKDDCRLDAPISILKAAKTSQWKEFSWQTLDFASLEHIVTSLATTSHDTLESLELQSWLYSTLSVDTVENIGANLNRLSRISMNLPSNLDPGTIVAPWSQLTYLCIVCAQTDEKTLLNILRQLSSIEECVLDFNTLSLSSQNNNSHPIILAKLRTLKLFNSVRLFSTITRALVTPILQNLVIHSEDAFEILHEDSVYQFLLSNAKTLRRLWICGITLDSEELIPNLSFLEELAVMLNDDMGTVDIFDIFRVCRHLEGIEDDTMHISLPHLCALKLICNVDFSIQKAFIELVQARWDICEHANMVPPAPTRLRYASLQDIQSYDVNNIDVLAEIERFRREGLDVDLLSGVEAEYTPDFKYFNQ